MVKTRVSIRNLTQRKNLPDFAYAKIAQEVLPGWDISLVFVKPAQAQSLNMTLRRKSYIPNVLSYRTGIILENSRSAKQAAAPDQSGEILICPSEAARQAPLHDMDTDHFILSLFIHGLLHIKGWEHGGTMEKCEKKLLKKFARSAHYVETRSSRH